MIDRSAVIGGGNRRIIEVGPFSPREALSYLTGRLGEPGMRAGALDLASDLGCLPLSLAMASAVVADSHSGCRRYREPALCERAIHCQRHGRRSHWSGRHNARRCARRCG